MNPSKTCTLDNTTCIGQMMFVSFSSITTGVTSGAETANPFGGHPRFLVGFVLLDL
jgi:hypothetical protein